MLLVRTPAQHARQRRDDDRIADHDGVVGVFAHELGLLLGLGLAPVLALDELVLGSSSFGLGIARFVVHLALDPLGLRVRRDGLRPEIRRDGGDVGGVDVDEGLGGGGALLKFCRRRGASAGC